MVECDRAAYLDGLVLAYRVHPPLLAAATEDPQSERVLRRLLARSRDYELARRAAIVVKADDPDGALGALTRRELEVLDLVAQGKEVLSDASDDEWLPLSLDGEVGTSP